MGESDKTIVVIGAQTAGLGAATAAKRKARGSKVIVLERLDQASTASCGLPYFVSGEIQREEALTVVAPALLREKVGLDLRLGHEAVAIDVEKSLVFCRETKGQNEYEIAYDSLIIATGASPIVPPVEGIDAENVFVLRTIADAVSIKRYIKGKSGEPAVVVGGGFIGLEMAEALSRRGLSVTLVEMLETVLPTWDKEITRQVEQTLQDNGVSLKLNSPLEKVIIGRNNHATAVVAGGEAIQAALVILALGVRPNVSLAKSAGILVGKTGAIATDSHQMTSVQNIYAAGDCCQVRDMVTGQALYVPLATVAEKQGKTAGENAAGYSSTFNGALATAISRVFGLVFARTGITEKEARKAGLHFAAQTFLGHSHSSYYPQAKPLRLKIVFDPRTGRLLGAQAAGHEGVMARINTMVAAIYAGLTVKDIAQLDLPYAPPFSSSWDPLHIVASMGERRLRPEK